MERSKRWREREFRRTRMNGRRKEKGNNDTETERVDGNEEKRERKGGQEREEELKDWRRKRMREKGWMI